MTNALKANAYFPFEVLRDSFARLDRKLKSLAYAQSYTLVKYLIQKHGWAIIKELLDAFDRGESLETGLRTWGLNLYLMEKEWERDLLKKI